MTTKVDLLFYLTHSFETDPIKVLEAFVAAEVEHDHDGYDFGGGHAVSSKILPFAFRSFRSKGVDLDEFVKYFAEIVDFTENISNFV